MPGELKTRRRRRGGVRGRGRRRGGRNARRGQNKQETAAAAVPEENKGNGDGSEVRALLPAVSDSAARSGESSPPPAAAEPGGAAETASAVTPKESSDKKPSRPRRRRVTRRRRGSAEKRQADSKPQEPAAAAQPVPEEPRRAPRSASRAATARSRGHQESKTIVVNSTRHETRVAILEKGTLAEIFIERDENRTVVGNIYKGKVSKVLPGMQSAFVTIGLERDAFLYVSDISPGYDAYEGLLDLDEVEGGDEIRDAAPEAGREAKIKDLIKEKQDLLVQVTKEPIGTKGARITSYVTIPGRFLVLMPQVDHVGVSRKIGDARERARLRRIIDKVRPKGMGFIVRTVAEKSAAEDLETDANYLLAKWEEIRSKAERASAPAELKRDLSLVPRLLRDTFDKHVSKVVIDSKEVYEETLETVKNLQPELQERIQLHRDPFPIFDKYGIQAELDKALRSRVWLKSGGYIVINQTEALVAIDVNTGKYVGKRSLEDTVLKTNLEAATEIVRQLRLRDLGGIIVVDFIDMEERKSKKKLIDLFVKELQKDKARTKVLQISDFGLVEITRQRTKKSLERILCETCPYCSGSGKVKTPATVVFEIQRELKKLASSLDGKSLVVRVNPVVARRIESDRTALTAGTGKLEHMDVSVKSDSTLHHELFEIVSL